MKPIAACDALAMMSLCGPCAKTVPNTSISRPPVGTTPGRSHWRRESFVASPASLSPPNSVIRFVASGEAGGRAADSFRLPSMSDRQALPPQPRAPAPCATTSTSSTCSAARALIHVFDADLDDADVDDTEPRAFLITIGMRLATHATSRESLGIYRLVVAETPRFPELARICQGVRRHRRVAQSIVRALGPDGQTRRIRSPSIRRDPICRSCRGNATQQGRHWNAAEASITRCARCLCGRPVLSRVWTEQRPI